LNYKNLTILQTDALKEFFNIGAGYAATSLSSLLNKGIGMTVPKVKIVPFEKLFEEDAENEVYAVVIRVLGDIRGNMLFLFDEASIRELIEVLIGEHELLSDMGRSALGEVGNIIASSYMNAIASFTGLFVMPSVPAITYDMIGAILSTLFIESGQFDEFLMDIETDFSVNESKMKAHFYYIPEKESLEKILSKLGTI
jgi:chemotaxis protein CheC